MIFEPTVSIIILTYNSEKTLAPCLQAVSELDYPAEKYQIIILDNGSTDSTSEIIQSHGFTCHPLPHHNLSQLRNHGAEISQTDIIAYIDSDCIPAKDWLRQVTKWFSDPQVGIAGNEYLLPVNSSVFEKNWYDKSNFGICEDELIPAGNMALRKDYFFELGGFNDTLLTGEDDYITGVFRQNGYKTISDHQIHSIHLGNSKSLVQYFKKEIWYGMGMLGTLRFSAFDKPLLATLLFFIFLLVAVILYVTSLVLDDSRLFISGIVSGLSAGGIPLLAAYERIYRKNRRGNFLYVSLVFIVFFTARLCALVKIVLISKNSE